MSSQPSKEPPMTQIRWVRATFTGAMVGGVVWALIFGVASLHFLAMPWQARTVLWACVVNGVLLALSWLLWRSSSDEKARTRAAALWVVPFLGIAFLAAAFTFGVGYDALRSS
jgi:hypothetical protein